METRTISAKRIVAILLLFLGLVALVLGVLGLLGGGAMQPYDARNSVVLVAATVADDQGNTSMGWGTGWAIGKPGKPVEYIVTNGHVVEQAYTYPQLYTNVQGQLQVVFNAAENDFVIPEVVYYSAPQEKDIAILRLPTPTEKRIPLQLRPSETVDIGEAAWALGYPGISSMYQQYSTFSPDDITLTQGIISKRNKPTGSTYEAFQMDVYINSGNSGGGLFNISGQLIGIVNAKTSSSASGVSVEGLGYAIPSNTALRIANAIIEDGYVKDRPTLGVTVTQVTEGMQGFEPGLYVTEIQEDSPASKAGLQTYDRIIRFNGVDIESYTTLSAELNDLSVGDTVDITVIRNNEEVTLKITLGQASQSATQQ